MIEVKDLAKQYKIAKRDPGLRGAVKSLFYRKYETKEAVKGISLHIDAGEMVGYIGANGAGKSTTIKMLTGILTPTSGEVKVNGIVPYENRKQNASHIGAVFGQRTQLFWDIPVRESYELLKHIYEIPQKQYDETLAEFVDVLHLEPLLGIPVRQLSLGQKMRCELAAAFLHRPKVVYLDEPTIGLDVAVKVRIRSFIKQMNARYGTTVLLTTHDMQDIEEICQRIIIIDDGSVIYDGSIQNIKSQFGDKRVIHFDIENLDDFVLPQEIAHIAQILPREDEAPHKISITFSSKEISGAELISIIMNHYQVADLTIADPKIETIVEEIYGKGMKKEVKHEEVH